MAGGAYTMNTVRPSSLPPWPCSEPDVRAQLVVPAVIRVNIYMCVDAFNLDGFSRLPLPCDPTSAVLGRSLSIKLLTFVFG